MSTILSHFFNCHFFFRIRLESFESIRLIVVVGVIFHRIMIMPLFLQAYLNLAHRKVEDQKKEVGKMTNIEFQKKVR